MMDRMFRRRPASPKTAVSLTELGKKKAEEFSVEGPKFDVLTVLNDSGPCSIEEIADETHISTTKVRVIVRNLIRAGFARPVSGS